MPDSDGFPSGAEVAKIKNIEKRNRANAQLSVLHGLLANKGLGDPKKRAAAHDKLKRIEAAYETD